MVEIILYTGLLYLIQLILEGQLKRMGSNKAERAHKAVHNLRESLPIFLAFAILSIVFEVDQNISLAVYWLITRVVYAIIYISGLGLNPAAEGSTYEPQPIRGAVWAASVVLLVMMGLNLI